MIQLKRIDSSNYNDIVEPGQLVLEYNSTSSLPPRVKVGRLNESSSYQDIPYLVPDPSKYTDEGLYFPTGLNISCQQLNITAGTAAYLNGSPIATASSILNTGLKLIGVGTIFKHGTPYYSDPPEGTYIQTDNCVTFNDPAFLYDEGQDRYSQKHSYTSFVGYDHLVWDSTQNLYRLDVGPLDYSIKLAKVTMYLSGKLFPDSAGTTTAQKQGGFWYIPYCSPEADVPTWVDVGGTQGKTYLDVCYIPDEDGIYFGSTYSVTHKINWTPASTGTYYPHIGFSTYNNSKFVPGMGATFCKMVIELYASQSELIQ